jgi:hypothetical protein
VNHANLRESRRVLDLIDGEYEPLDWHIDFKSGYRWSPATWYLDVAYGHLPGVDVKVPWELARMQHLPMLAWAYALANDGQPGFAPDDVYAREFRNQVLDFIGNNPPRFGVNWRTGMDVAIRIANWLFAYDLLRAHGAVFDSAFEEEFGRSVYQHGVHILENLEWSPDVRGNHYLADIVGLLFAAAYLPSTPETDLWLAFGVQELIEEVQHQFNADGANFEASTSYHRLSAEMVVYATALTLDLGPQKRAALEAYDHTLHRVQPRLKPGPLAHHVQPGTDRTTRFPDWYFERLEKMAEFTQHTSKPNTRVPQVGDNDSGRFFKLWPTYEALSVGEARARYDNLEGYADSSDKDTYWLADELDHRHLVAAINGFFDREDFAAFAGRSSPEKWIVQRLAGCAPFSSYRGSRVSAAERVRMGSPENWTRIKTNLESSFGKHHRSTQIHVPGPDIRVGLALYAYPHFGIFVYKTRRVYLSIRCGSVGQDGNGGHAHNDQLAIELNVDGRDWIADPGTYLYTPLPVRRNEYRSAKAHSGPLVEDCEPSNLRLGLFRLPDTSRADCIHYGVDGFVGRHRGFGPWVYRVVELLPQSVLITDYVAGLIAPRDPVVASAVPAFSPAYGVRIRDAAPHFSATVLVDPNHARG